jgi:ATP-dependent RNA/DNA helicase IGHMBP2
VILIEGDIVGLVPSNAPMSATTSTTTGNQRGGGVVYRVANKSITVAFPKIHEQASEGNLLFATGCDDATSAGGHFNLTRLANDVTYKRMRKALESIKQKRGSSSSSSSSSPNRLSDVLFGSSCPVVSTKFPGIKPFNANLNESQLEAITFALGANDLALIHGPPGTGKTTTVAEFILQCVKRGERVLVAAPSNVAVDNIVEKLATHAKQANAKIVRVSNFNGGELNSVSHGQAITFNSRTPYILSLNTTLLNWGYLLFARLTLC